MISITCDVWTSKNGDSFFGITAHGINDSWEQDVCLLSFLSLHDRHTGANLAKNLLFELQWYGLTELNRGEAEDIAEEEFQSILDES